MSEEMLNAAKEGDLEGLKALLRPDSGEWLDEAASRRGRGAVRLRIIGRFGGLL